MNAKWWCDILVEDKICSCKCKEMFKFLVEILEKMKRFSMVSLMNFLFQSEVSYNRIYPLMYIMTKRQKAAFYWVQFQSCLRFLIWQHNQFHRTFYFTFLAASQLRPKSQKFELRLILYCMKILYIGYLKLKL